ncbi:MAG: FmdE family protein [Desulfobacteraceae bacterium]|jgi:formylmethanofuran dehydrogenase subunit E-like metal-binding protein
MKKRVTITFALAPLISLITWLNVMACGFEEYREIKYSKEMVRAMNAVFKARNALGLEKGDEKLLALTNAGYGIVKGKTTEPFLDIISNVTACTMGTRSLLLVQTAFTDPLWCALYRKDNNKLVLIKWSQGAFKQQNLDISPDRILHPEAWKQAASGLVGGKTLFSVVTICNSWAAGASWPLLKSAELHNHICPGLNVGYIIGNYLKKNHPLRKGEKYVFLAAPPICAIDTLQKMYDCTVGKGLTFAKAVEKHKVKRYSGNLWFEGNPLSTIIVIAMRANEKGNSCEGVVLGMDWKHLFEDTGVNYQDFAPPGGKSNPTFFISRATLSIRMASMNLEQKIKYIKELKRFFGQASLAHKLARDGTDPYAIIWGL